MNILSLKTLSLSVGLFALSAFPALAFEPDPSSPPNSSNLTVVVQSNETTITNLVGVVQNTGGNTVSGNVCSDATITTGETTATVKITNVAGSNDATVDTCATCATPSPSPTPDPCETCANLVRLSPITPKVTNTTILVQENQTSFLNGMLVGQNTGLNTVKNTVRGTATVTTAKTKATVKIKNLSGYNQALIY